MSEASSSGSLRNRSYPFKSLQPPDLTTVTRRELREYFINSYDLTELLFSGIKDDRYFYKSPDRLRLPLIFYLGHTATLYINKLVLAGLLEDRVNPHLEMMFEMGVDEMSWDDTENHRLGGAFSWPSVSEVMEYRSKVKQVVLSVIDSAPLQLPITVENPMWSMVMGIEHERIHVETSSVLINQLPVSMLEKPLTWKYAPPSMDVPLDNNDLLTVPGGSVAMGKPEDFPTFGWDNEYGAVTVEVPEFKASKYLITNREFLEFVGVGGYHQKEWWTDEGWKWVTYRQAKHPLLWICNENCKSGGGADLASYSHCTAAAAADSDGNNDEGRSDGDNKLIDSTSSAFDSPFVGDSKNFGSKFKYRVIFSEIAMPWDWPVIVNYHEVKAFCAWKGPNYRAPTEAEHHLMRGAPPPACTYSCDPSLNVDCPSSLHVKHGSPSPVNMYPPTSTGHYDVCGNVWDWAEDHLNGFPGGHTDYLYDDYSTPFYDGRHNLVMGGSWMSVGVVCSRFTRFGFRRHFYQHAGFRLVHSTNLTPVRLCQAEVFTPGQGLIEISASIPHLSESCWFPTLNPQFQYESKDSLQTELRRTYGSTNGYKTTMDIFLKALLQHDLGNKNSVLVLGSGTGYSSFTLTKHFSKVLGIEYCGRFIDAALSIQAGNDVSGFSLELSLEPKVHSQRVVFKQLTSVVNEIEDHDLILVEFLDRLNEPKGWLRKLHETVNQQQAVLVIIGSIKWDQSRLSNYIGKWFEYKDSRILASDQTMTIWKYLPRTV